MTKPTIPKHLDDRSAWTAADFVEYARDGSKPINPEWQAKRADAMADYGLEDAPEPSERQQPEDMSVQEHLERIKKAK